MKRLLFLILALLVTSSVWAASTVQYATDGKIDVDRLPTISFFQESDPASPELGQIWWNNSTAQLKVAGALGVYAFNSTSLVEWDTTPEAFSFTDVTNATTSTTYTSAGITVSGINRSTVISVSGDPSAKYIINNATATSAEGTVVAGDVVNATVVASADAGTAVNATVTIGGVSDVWSVTTAGGGGGETYLVDEDFEGVGAPDGWSTTAVTDWDYTATALSGSESLYINRTDSVDRVATVTFTNTFTTIYGAFEYRRNGDVKSRMLDIGSAYLDIDVSGDLDASIGGTSDNVADGTFIFESATNYYVWFKYNANNGSGGSTFDVYISTTNERPSSPETATSRGSTGSTATDLVFKTRDDAQVIIDTVRLSVDDFPEL